MVLPKSELICKSLLIIFSIILVVLGVVFLGLGLWLRFSEETKGIFDLYVANPAAFQSNDVQIGVYILVALGLGMMIAGVFGKFCVYSETKWALQLFAVVLFFLAVAEVLVGVLALLNRDEVGKRLEKFYTDMYFNVDKNSPAVGVSFTFIHNLLHCCGVTGAPLTETFNLTCPNPDGLIMTSCPKAIPSFFDKLVHLVMGIFVGIGGLLFIGVICSSVFSLLIFQHPNIVTLQFPNPHLPEPPETICEN